MVVGVCFYNRRRKNKKFVSFLKNTLNENFLICLNGIFLLLYCSTSPQVPVHYNAGQDGNVVLGNRCSSTPVYEDIDAYRVGFNNQGIPSDVMCLTRVV